MQQAQVSNPNDSKVVSFHNNTEFGFLPEMGCMYDGRPINGKNGSPGIDAGEEIILPYHIGNQLAINLAKRVLNTSQSASVDAAGIPTGVPIWSETKLKDLSSTYIKELYSEARPIAQSETDKLMAKVEEYKLMVDKLVSQSSDIADVPMSDGYKDKAEVIAELTKRGIKFDARQNKDSLQKLLA